jgi:hypothetical protein
VSCSGLRTEKTIFALIANLQLLRTDLVMNPSVPARGCLEAAT